MLPHQFNLMEMVILGEELWYCLNIKFWRT